jgi:flavin-dependent dehydrogenase
VKYEGPWNDHRYGFHFYSPGGKRFKVGDWSELKKDPVKNSKGVALSKGKLLAGILAEAQAAGVEYFANTNVTGVAIEDDGITVATNHDDFQGRFVVAADGVNSRIVRSLGLNKQRQFSGTTRYLPRVMTGVKPPEAEGILFIMTMYGTFSISQVCDKDHYHVSIVSNDPKDELETLLERFTHDDPVFSPWFRNAKRVDDECCVVNTLQAVEKPFHRNVILVGDACWSYQFSNVMSLTAGHHLGHALTRAFLDGKINEEGVAPYLEWYDTRIYKPHGQLPFRGGNLTEYLTAEEMDYLAALPAEAAPPTASFTRLFHTILETYMPLSERIREDHPAILEKFKAMGEDMEKNLEKKKKAGFPNR